MDFQRAMAFLESGTYQPGTLENRHWDYYDRAILSSGTQRYQFYKVPNGQAGKGYSDTNFPLAGQMPESERMVVLYFETCFVPNEVVSQATWLEIINLFKNSYIEFSILNKAPMIQIPLHSLFGSVMPMIIAGAAAGDQAFIRDPLRSCYELDVEIPLASKSTFKAEWIHDTAPAAALDDYELYFHMVGPRFSF